MSMTIKFPDWFEQAINGIVAVAEQAAEAGMPKEAESIFLELVEKLGGLASSEAKVEMVSPHPQE